MKRLVLVGGSSENKQVFNRELLETLYFAHDKKELNIALCYFARPESAWSLSHEKNSKQLDEATGKDQSAVIRLVNHNNFVEVCEWADVVYLGGGDPNLLLDGLKDFDLARSWEGKTVVGSSAGADILCKEYVYLQDKTIGKGLGWLSLALIPHWATSFAGYTTEEWLEAESNLLKNTTYPVLRLSEGEFAEFTLA